MSLYKVYITKKYKVYTTKKYSLYKEYAVEEDTRRKCLHKQRLAGPQLTILMVLSKTVLWFFRMLLSCSGSSVTSSL